MPRAPRLVWGEEDVGKVRQEAKARLREREGRAVKEVLRLGRKSGSHRYAQNAVSTGEVSR